MLATFILLAFSIHTFAQVSPIIDENKFTICAITIGSDDEKKVFQKQVEKYPTKFNPIVELTDMGSSDWFSKACKSGIRCDQLIISGHYAGVFFNDSIHGKTLDARELETAGCSKTCEGILSNPLEVFLFGCNTLAKKDRDHRTPAQYLQVLLNDGFPVSQAELIVESRYGETGDSTEAIMRRSFNGPLKKIYGFDSVGPYGKTIKPYLENYFKKTNAATHLENLQGQRLIGMIEESNVGLAKSLRLTAFAECNQAEITDEKSKLICRLFDTKVSSDEKLSLSLELLIRKDFLTYLPSINQFIKTLKRAPLTESQKEDLALISNNPVIKGQLIGLIDKSEGLGMKAEWAELAVELEYLSVKEAHDKMMPKVRKIFEKPISQQDFDQLLVFDQSTVWSNISISNSDVINRKLSARDIEAFSLFTINDGKLLQRILDFNPNQDQILKRFIADIIIYSGDKNHREHLKYPEWFIPYLKEAKAAWMGSGQ